jgi:hypothetical protein
MKSFTTYIVNMMKKEQLFASQGGNIILAQVIIVDILFYLQFSFFSQQTSFQNSDCMSTSLHCR